MTGTSPSLAIMIKRRRMRLAGHVVHIGEKSNAYKVLVGKPEGKRPLGGPKHRWEDNIKMNVLEIRLNGANWINLAQNRDMWRVP
jgi:hypothetical protein